jgi:hypothetical protein
MHVDMEVTFHAYILQVLPSNLREFLATSPIQWVPGAPYLQAKRRGREAHHSPPSSAEVKECMEVYLYSPSRTSWRGA